MRAAIVRAHGAIDDIEVVDDHPEGPLGAHDVRVAVRATALNYHDLFTLRGMPGIRVPMPIAMGIDVAGEVVELGSAVSTAAIGDRVLIDPEDSTRTRGMIGEMFDGGLCERVTVRAEQLIDLPGAVAFEEAACLPVAYGTALRMMVTRGRVAPGERVLVLGASGGVGTGCVQIAKLLGAEVVACAAGAAKAERLKALGANHVIDYKAVDFQRAVAELYGKPRTSGGGGVDVVVNFTGGDTLVPSVKCLAVNGRLLTCGATAGFESRIDLRYVWTFEQSVIGSNGWSRQDLMDLLEMVRSGRITPVIDRVFPLADVREAFRRLEDRTVFGKVLVVHP